MCTREKSGRPTTDQSRCAAPFAPCLRLPTIPVRPAAVILYLLITPSRACRRIPHINIRHATEREKRTRAEEPLYTPTTQYFASARGKHLMMTRPTPPKSTQKIIQTYTQRRYYNGYIYVKPPTLNRLHPPRPSSCPHTHPPTRLEENKRAV